METLKLLIYPNEFKFYLDGVVGFDCKVELFDTPRGLEGELREIVLTSPSMSTIAYVIATSNYFRGLSDGAELFKTSKGETAVK